MAANLSAIIKYLGHPHIAIKSIVTGKPGAQEEHFQAIAINKAEEFITLRNGKRQMWINLQKLKPDIGKYIAFSDIESYKNIYIDLDCIKPDGFKDYAATEEERAKALSQLHILRVWLESHSLRCGLELHTGNGAGMVLPIPETKAEPVFIAKLSTFLKKVQADIPCTDPAMFDPPRVIGIPGTINAKLETEERKNQVREIVGDIQARVEDQALLDFIKAQVPDQATLKEWSKKYNEPQAQPETDKDTVDEEDILDRLTGLYDYEPELKALLDGHIERFKGDRSAAEYGVCGRLVKFGFTDTEIDFIMCKVSKIGKWAEEGPHYRFEQTLRKLREAEAGKEEPKGMNAEAILERIRADPRALKDPAILAALADMKVNDPIEFDLLINAIKGVTKDVKPETIRKIVDKYIADANRAAAKAKQREQHKKRDLGKLIRELDSEELTEGGKACRLERICGEEMRYCHTFKKWFLWDKGRWRVDSDGGAMRCAGGVVAALYVSAGQADGKDARDAMAGFAKETDTRKGLSNMLAIAANRLQFAITSEALDTDAWLLGAGDVTIDLKAGTIREPCREDLITKAIGTKYDKAAKCPGWLKFLDHIFHKDEKVIAYIKRAFGYCLTATMVEQVFFFCYGMGANGKSVFLAILRALLGEYAKQADFSTFLVQRNEKVRNDLAALAGARVITATEAEEGSKLSMQIIKAWTGGDPITARFLFAENFTFKPEGKLWLAANTKPTISERNLAAWRRVQLIPFDVTIAKKDQDKELESKLLEELPGILNWALEGLQEYQQSGLDTPDVVKVATEKYREENDSMAAFLKECCDIQKLKVCKNRDIFTAYLNFCGMSGFKPLSQTKFSPELGNNPGITATRDMHGMIWIGIDLKKDWNPCRVEDNPTSTSVDVKHVGLPQNAQASSNPPTRGNLAQKPTYPTYPTSKEPIDNDLEKTNPTYNHVEGGEGGKGEDAQTSKNSGFETFKAKVRSHDRHICSQCGNRFDEPLIMRNQSGYYCETCRRDGPPPAPAHVDAQVKLSEVA